MTNIVHLVHGNLVSKPNKFGIEAYLKDGVRTILKDNNVIKTITKERVFNGQVELTHINNYKNNELVGSALLRKDFNEDGRILSALYSKHNESGSSVDIFMHDENGKFIQIKQSGNEFLQHFLNFLGVKE